MSKVRYLIYKGRRGISIPLQSLLNGLLWVRLSGLLVELWSEPILRKLLKQIDNVIKIDIDSEEVSKERFALVCVQVDLSRPLKMELKYNRVMLLNLLL